MKKKIKVDKEYLFDLYITKKLSSREVAKRIGANKTFVLYWLKKYKIPARDNKTAKLETRGIKIPSKEQIEEDYKKLSLELIAKKYMVSTEAVYTWLKKYEITKRNPSESQKLAHKTGRSVSWNKGMNKDDQRIAKILEKLFRGQKEKKEESKLKMSLTKKKLFSEGKIKSWNKGKNLSPEHRRKLSEAKKKISDTKEFKDRMKKIGSMAKSKLISKPEKILKELLLENKLDEGLISQYKIEIGELLTFPDFAYPNKKIAIYVDGDYWHGKTNELLKMKDCPRTKKIKETMEKDARQHKILWDNGWVSLRFWENDIKNNPKEVIKTIKNYLDKN